MLLRDPSLDFWPPGNNKLAFSAGIVESSTQRPFRVAKQALFHTVGKYMYLELLFWKSCIKLCVQSAHRVTSGLLRIIQRMKDHQTLTPKFGKTNKHGGFVRTKFILLFSFFLSQNIETCVCEQRTVVQDDVLLDRRGQQTVEKNSRCKPEGVLDWLWLLQAA